MAEDQNNSDVTENAVAQLAPITAELRSRLPDDLTDDDWLAIGWALSDAIKLGMRLGIAEVSGTVMEAAREQGIDLRLYPQIIDPSEDEPRYP